MDVNYERKNELEGNKDEAVDAIPLDPKEYEHVIEWYRLNEFATETTTTTTTSDQRDSAERMTVPYLLNQDNASSPKRLTTGAQRMVGSTTSTTTNHLNVNSNSENTHSGHHAMISSPTQNLSSTTGNVKYDTTTSSSTT